MSMMRIGMVATLAAAAVAIFTENASAQGRMDLPSGGGWAPPRCQLLSSYYVVFPCGDADLFLTSRVPMNGKQRCCSALEFTASETVTVGADCKFKACGAEWTVKVEGSHTFSTTDKYDGAAPCGCVQLYWEQDFRVRKQKRTFQRCYTTGNPSRPWEPGESWTEERIIKDKVPSGSRPVPYYYQNPNGCPGCTNGRPNNASTPAPALWDPNVPGGFPAAIPNARPQPETVPWNPSVHGPVNFDAAMAPDGADKQVTIDLQPAWASRKITSVISLNLFECGWIIQSLAELRTAPANAGNKTRVDVLIADGVRLAGTVSGMTAELEKYANAMVNAKTYGDFDGNGERNIQDVQMLQDKMLNPGDISELRLYDMNGDNDVDDKDLTLWYQLVGL